jgi:acetyl-CoA C-acetyltransferase
LDDAVKEDAMNDVVITAALRSAVGKFGGSIAKVSAVDLGAQIIRALLARTGVIPAQISEVILGQVLTAGVGQNPARQALIRSGIPDMVPGRPLGVAMRISSLPAAKRT